MYQVILTVLFLCMISFSFLNDFFGFYKVPETSQTENRKLASKPSFDINKLDPYPKSYGNYFNDQFPFREDLRLLNSLICYYVLHQSPLPGEVEVGKHGWFFSDQKESVVYQGKFDLAKYQISSLVKELHNRTIDYGKKGIRFYVAFPPMKPEIYPEYLPIDFRRAPNGTVTDKIVKAIKEDPVIQYIDLKTALLKAKKFGRLYNHTDNHWNRIGAFYGYNEIIGRILKDFPEIKPVTRSDFFFKTEIESAGNQANMIGLSKYLFEIQYKPIFRKSKSKYLQPIHKAPDWASYIMDYEVSKSTGDTTLPSVVIVRDSYASVMMPFLDETFHKVTYIFDAWRYGRNEAIIADMKPDIVILIIFEPHISHLIGK